MIRHESLGTVRWASSTNDLTKLLTTGIDRRNFFSSFVGDTVALLHAVSGPWRALLSALSEHESEHPIIPASDHSARTVSFGSIGSSPSGQRRRARESAHQTRARPQGSRGGMSDDRTDRNPQGQGAPRAGSSSGALAVGCSGTHGASWSPLRATSCTRPRHQARRLVVPAIDDRDSHASGSAARDDA